MHMLYSCVLTPRGVDVDSVIACVCVLTVCPVQDLTDEQLPRGVYRDENGELYDEDY